VSTTAASEWFGISRQSYYQAKQRKGQEQAEAGLLLALVQGVRQRHPRLGVRKLYHEIADADEAIYLYNFERPHLALGYAKPAQIFFKR
jgi:transposase InsO family protein